MTIDSVVERVADGGNLLRNLNLIDISTWQTASEVFADWKAVAHSNPVEDAYKTLLGNQIQAVEVMTPEIAVGLSSILDTYKARIPSIQ